MTYVTRTNLKISKICPERPIVLGWEDAFFPLVGVLLKIPAFRLYYCYFKQHNWFGRQYNEDKFFCKKL